ncbi:hypothetical protein WJX72_011781 [[Myrmecia] bisecta]|uniref:Uncharacterized protein n=1 Tax=[Myrmecia] bisecta TaxID=41462 RepID=A0AAW1QGT1_9CHLO
MPAAAFLAAHSQLLCRGLQTYSAPWRVVELYPRLSAGTAAGSVHCSATSRRSPVKLTAEELSAELDPSDLETEANLVFEAEAHTQAYQAAVQQLFADVQEQQQEAAGELSQPGRPPALRADDPDAQQHLQEAQQYLSTVLAKGDVQDRDAVCSRVLQRSFRWRSRGNARLSCLEAPEVASIRERVQFLRQLGLSWAGVGSALERVPFLLGFSTDQMARVTMFLAGLGLSREDIAYVVDIEPRILGFSVKGSLIPAVGCFRRLGITNADLIKLLAKLPSVFGLSTERSLEPKVHFYLSLGIQKAELPRIFLLCPQLLSVRLDRMQTKLDCLASYDVSKKTITRLLTRFPAVFSWNEQRIVSTLNFLLSLGVPRPSLDKIIYRHPHIFRSKVETVLQPAVAWFAGHGVPLSKLVPVISKHPAMLCFQVEGKLSESVAYLKDLGFSETEISRTLLEDEKKSLVQRMIGIDLA